jgi:hypothetical protein
MKMRTGRIGMFTVAAGLSHLLGGCVAHTSPVAREASYLGKRVLANQGIVRASELDSELYDVAINRAGNDPEAWQLLADTRAFIASTKRGLEACKKTLREACGTAVSSGFCEKLEKACDTGSETATAGMVDATKDAFDQLMPVK